MALLRRLLARIVSILRTDHSDRELTKEIESHLALLEDDFVAKGMSPAEAKRAARLAFGGVDQARERHHDARSFRWIEDIPRDAAYAMRSLRRSFSFTIAAVLTLAIGIGATTTIYSVVNTVLLSPLPFAGSDRIVSITEPERPRTAPGINYQ